MPSSSHWFVVGGGAFAVMAGAVTLVGWFAAFPWLTDWFGSGIAMFANTAACAVGAGAALILAILKPRWCARLSSLLGAGVALLGGATLFQHVSGIALGIDTFLVTPNWGTRAAMAPGRMGPPASVSFTLLGLALWLLARDRVGARKIVPALGIAVCGVAALSLMGYVSGADPLYAVARYTGIALQTATVLFALALAVVASVPECEPMRTIRQNSAAGLLARRSLPFIIAVPIVLGWLGIRGQQAGWFDTAMETSVLTLMLVLIFSGLLWWWAGAVAKHESALRESRAQEQARRKELEAVLEAAPAIVWIAHDRDCKVITGNRAAAACLGMIDGKNMSLTAPGDEAPRHFRVFCNGKPLGDDRLPIQLAARTGEPVTAVEVEHRFDDGTVRNIFGNAVPLFDEQGQPRGSIGAFIDITERKRAEGELRHRSDQLATLIARAPLGVYLVGADFRLVQVNPVALRAFGDIPGGVIGRDFDEIIRLLWKENFADEIVRIFRHTLESGESYVTAERAEYRIDRQVTEYYEWRLDRVTLPDGRHGLVCYFRDISQHVEARKQIEQSRDALRESECLQRLLAQVGELGARLPETDELIGAICERVAMEMNVSRCGYTIADPVAGTFTVRKDYCGALRSLAGVYPMSEFSNPKHASEDVIATEDLAAQPDIAEKYRRRWAPLDLRALLSVPLRRESQLAAIFWVAHHEPRRWTRAELELMKLVADRVWVVVERKRAEKALRESEALLASVLRQLPVGLGVTDPAGKWIVSNALMDEVAPCGLPSTLPEQANRWRAYDANGQVVAPENWPGRRALRGEIVSPGVEALFTGADGRERWLRVGAAPLRADAGDIVGAIFVAQDVDQIKRAQQKIAEQARALEAAHERLHGIISSAMDAVITIDAHQCIVLFNPAAERMFGLTAREAEGRPIDCLIPGQFRASHARFVDAFGSTEGRNRRMGALGAIRGRRVNGEEFPVEASLSQVQLGNERLFTVILRDVTERVKAEERLGRLAAIVENSRDAIVSKTPEGIVTSWNRGAEALFGYSAAEMIGCSIRKIIPPEEDGEEDLILLRLRAGDSVHRETVRLKKNGQRMPVSITCSPIKDAEGRIIGGAKIARDITEQKETDEKLRDAQRRLLIHAADLEATVAERTAKLRETVNDLQSFSYSIAHDMRAPLRAMGMFAQLLADEIAAGALSPATMDYCGRIIVGANRLDNLINDALNYTKAALREMPLQPVDLAKLVRGLVDTYPNLHAPRAEIRIDNDLPTVLGNESLLTQCFSNLLGNAVKFVAPGVRPHAWVRSEAGDNNVRIWVEDNGIGIPKHAHPRLFSMFQKLDNRYEGTGIGLAIVRKVVERMGGKVGVESEPDLGSRFWVELKAAKAEDL